MMDFMLPDPPYPPSEKSKQPHTILEKKMSSQQVAQAQKRTKELRAMIDAKMKAASK